MGGVEDRLRDLLIRELRHLSMTQIAKESGCDRASLSLFRYRNRHLSKAHIDRLMKNYGLDLELVPRFTARQCESLEKGAALKNISIDVLNELFNQTTEGSV